MGVEVPVHRLQRGDRRGAMKHVAYVAVIVCSTVLFSQGLVFAAILTGLLGSIGVLAVELS